MSCDIIARVGKTIKIETETLVIEDQSVDENHLVCDTLQFAALVGNDCKAGIEEAILTIKNNPTANNGEFSVYLFNEDPGTVAANDEIDLSSLYSSLIGIINFTQANSTLLNNNTGEIYYYRGVIDDSAKENLILNTAVNNSIIYALVFNESGVTNFNGNTIQLTLKVWRY